MIKLADLEHASIQDGNLWVGFTALGSLTLHLFNDVHSIDDCTKNYVLPIQPNKTIIQNECQLH